MRHRPYRTVATTKVALDTDGAEPVEGIVAALVMLAAGVAAIASGTPLGVVLAILGAALLADEVRCRTRSRA